MHKVIDILLSTLYYKPFQNIFDEYTSHETNVFQFVIKVYYHENKIHNRNTDTKTKKIINTYIV